jgi:probable HAF family extracellular repeat protein
MIIKECFKVRHFILAAVFVTGLGPLTHAAAQQRSFLVDLNTRTATLLDTIGENAIASGINDAGQVVGSSFTSGAISHSFITNPSGVGITDLGSLGVLGSEANGINNAGQVVGTTSQTSGQLGAFITGPDGVGMRAIGKLEGDTESSAWGINNSGQVVGLSVLNTTSVQSFHAFITGPNGVGMRALGTLGGGSSGPQDINDAGQVVGDSVTAEGRHRAFITGPNGVEMRDLGTLAGDHRSDAWAINNAGQVVGGSLTAAGLSHAFITGPDGLGMRALGTLEGDAASYAWDINDAGQVVGSSVTAEGLQRAFFTDSNGTGMTDLNSFVELPQGVILTEAMGINNNGQVVAVGVGIVPEPETYAMLLAGLGLVGFMARNRKLRRKKVSKPF